ncbi:hypothetical protein H4R35_003873, partial [Dimargaris xerosporica]
MACPDDLSDILSNVTDSDPNVDQGADLVPPRPATGGKGPAHRGLAALPHSLDAESSTPQSRSTNAFSDDASSSLSSTSDLSAVDDISDDSDGSFYDDHRLPPIRPTHGGKQPRVAQRPPKRSAAPVAVSDDELLDDEDLPMGVDSSDSDEFTTSKRSAAKKQKKKSSMEVATQPKRGWGVPHDPVFIPMPAKQFEKILSHRPAKGDQPEQFLIKYKHTSYLHVEWVARDVIESEHLGKHRVKKFLAQLQALTTQWSDEPFNPSYTQVDRVIDEGELFDPATETNEVFVLVKWCAQPYDDATWEKIDIVREMDPEKLAEFHERRLPPNPTRSHTQPRPPRNQFQQLTESPKFKYDNTLRSYQLEGLNWLLFCWFNRQSCIMADEMGLGKTVQSVSFLNQIHQAYGIHGPFLVVAPLSTVPHWEREFRNWTHLNVLVYHGSVTARNLIVETEYYYKDAEGRVIPHYYKFDVVITTYEMISAGSPHLRPIPWRAAVFDEAHRLKNRSSKVLDLLNGYSLEHRLLLTGTPLQNSMHELFSLLSFLQPERFYDEGAFISQYGSLKTAEEVARVQDLLKPLMLRRFKEDVEKTIPVKEETIVEVELTSYQKKFYRAILEKNFTWLKNGAKGAQAGPSLINIMVELRKCCMHPFLINGAEERILKEVNPQTPDEYLSMLIEASGKLVLIDKLLRRLRQDNHKVLIFSQMTRCLDILADYLAARQYQFERIDGSIRGVARQAAIDRFSTDPNSFVFLLCTRAGGVGINLTAADTCVIYDSDWNPQNDLQAQARCHRIGQTKPVKIYRLLTRNTYEKEMFDKAGMKLGLDKALLQKMDVQSALRSGVTDLADGGGSKPPSALSKKEVEELLKKGAYGALMDDDGASAQFCEEDIDQILDRRTTVIRHNANESGSIFSKASFTVAAGADDVDIDDPEFWDKWAKKADIDVTEDSLSNPLIIQEPRQRRAAMRYNESLRQQAASLPNSDSEDDDEYGRRRFTPQNKIWSLAEKTRLERKLMVWGYGKWGKLHDALPRRQPEDLHAVTRSLVIYALQLLDVKTSEDRELLQDIRDVAELAGDPISDDELVPGREHIRGIPYPSATKRQITEYRSFLLDSPADYLDHIKKKWRNLLLRMQLMHIIRDKLVPADWEEAKCMPVPKVVGSQPGDWWGMAEDRDLILGIYKYGYQQYHHLIHDPELHFHQRHFVNAPLPDEEDGPVAADGASTHSGATPNAGRSKAGTPAAAGGDGEGLTWPTKAEIGMRLRRLISAFLRQHHAEQKRAKRQEAARELALHNPHYFGHGSQASSPGGNGHARPHYGGKKITSVAATGRARSSRWTKREQHEFYKTLMSFGVETTRAIPAQITWITFRRLANLSRKDDQAMEQCLRALVQRCRELTDDAVDVDELLPGIDFNSLGASLSSASPPPIPQELSFEGNLLTREKARRVTKRMLLLNEVRECADYPALASALAVARWFNYMPKWWECSTFDVGLVRGVAAYGIGRGDLLKIDPDLPFYQHFQRASESHGDID